jgi:hypothetical protein
MLYVIRSRSYRVVKNYQLGYWLIICNVDQKYCPTYHLLSCSVEEKYIPRIKYLKVLDSFAMAQHWCSEDFLGCFLVLRIIWSLNTSTWKKHLYIVCLSWYWSSMDKTIAFCINLDFETSFFLNRQMLQNWWFG